jgi:hypothetical protein
MTLASLVTKLEYLGYQRVDVHPARLATNEYCCRQLDDDLQGIAIKGVNDCYLSWVFDVSGNLKVYGVSPNDTD